MVGSDLPQTTRALRGVLDSETGPLASLSNKLETETLVVIEDSITRLTEQLSSQTLGDLSATLKQADTTLNELEATLTVAQERLQPDDPISYELKTALEEISSSAAAFRSLVTYIEANPESVLRGRD